MAKKRFDLTDTMEEVNNFIQSPKEEKNENSTYGSTNGDEPNRTNAAECEAKTESRVGENDPSVPDVKYKRNITLSEEMLWRLNYIKEKKNKSRAKGDKFVTIDQLMFDMVQFALDEKFGSTKSKFLESKKDEDDFF